MVRNDAFNHKPVGLPAQNMPLNQRNYLYASIASIEVSAIADYTAIPAPGVGQKICIWGFQVDNGQPSTILSGSLYGTSTAGTLKGRLAINGVGTKDVTPPLPLELNDNEPLVFSASQSSGVANRSYLTVYYTVVGS